MELKTLGGKILKFAQQDVAQISVGLLAQHHDAQVNPTTELRKLMCPTPTH